VVSMYGVGSVWHRQLCGTVDSHSTSLCYVDGDSIGF